jgi:hypothetical protein
MSTFLGNPPGGKRGTSGLQARRSHNRNREEPRGYRSDLIFSLRILMSAGIFANAESMEYFQAEWMDGRYLHLIDVQACTFFWIRSFSSSSAVSVKVISLKNG